MCYCVNLVEWFRNFVVHGILFLYFLYNVIHRKQTIKKYNLSIQSKMWNETKNLIDSFDLIRFDVAIVYIKFFENYSDSIILTFDR